MVPTDVTLIFFGSLLQCQLLVNVDFDWRAYFATVPRMKKRIREEKLPIRTQVVFSEVI